jgi:hypothetical protein
MLIILNELIWKGFSDRCHEPFYLLLALIPFFYEIASEFLQNFIGKTDVVEPGLRDA